MARHDRGKVASIVVYMLEHGESFLFLKALQTQSLIFIFLEVLSFLFFINMQQGWVGGIFLHHDSIASLNVASTIVIIDSMLCSTHLMS